MSEELQEFRNHVRRFADSELQPIAEQLDQPGTLPSKTYSLLASNGYLGGTIPEEYGGGGLSLREACVIQEEFSRAAYRFAAAAAGTDGGFARILLNHGTEEQRLEVLPALCDGSKKLAFGLTEPDAGSDSSAIRTQARPAEGGWRINGRKHYISLGHEADWVLLFASTDKEKGNRGGITAFLLPTDAEGFEVGRVEVTIGNDEIAELSFSDYFAPHSAVVGDVGRGFQIAMESLVEGRLGVAACCIGAADRAQELAVDHAKTRQTFGKPLADRQAIQWMLVDNALELQIARDLLNAALSEYEEGFECRVRSSMCKLFCSEMVGKVTDRAMQIFGGAGMVRGAGLERLYRENRHFRVGEGTSEVHRMIIARSLLTD